MPLDRLFGELARFAHARAETSAIKEHDIRECMKRDENPTDRLVLLRVGRKIQRRVQTIAEGRGKFGVVIVLVAAFVNE